MSDKIVYGLGGIVLGALGMKSSQTGQECVSTPLLDNKIIPVPTRQDYMSIIDFPGDVNKSDFLYSSLLFDGTNIYHIGMSLKIFSNKLNFNIRTVYPTVQNIIDTEYDASYQFSDIAFSISSEIGTIVTNYENYSTTVIINIPSFNINLDYIINSIPFKFNNGNIAIIKPNELYVKGMEFPGNISGTVNGKSVTGFGIFERLNWNFNEFDVKGYRWIPFSTYDGKLRGIVCRVGHYYDGCFWYNGKYYGLDYIDISTQSYSGTSKKTQLITATSGSDILFVQLNSFFTELGIRNYCIITAFLNNVNIGNGLSWEDSSPL